MTAEFAFKDHIDMFPSGRGSDVPSPIDAAWLDGADLLVIEMAYAGRLTRSGRQRTLHLPAAWPWAGQLIAAFARLRALPASA